MKTQVSTATHDKYGFPLRECTRCGGCGHHSRNLRFGSTCFKCGGTGRNRTVAAAREYRKWTDAVAAAQMTRIADLLIGDRVLESTGMGGLTQWWVLAAIEVAESGGPTLVLKRRGAQDQRIVYQASDVTVRVYRGDAQPKPDEYAARAVAKAK